MAAPSRPDATAAGPVAIGRPRAPTQRVGSARRQRQVSGRTDHLRVSRHQQQFREIGDLCRSGEVARAIDLAFVHFAAFGREDRIIELLAHAISENESAGTVRRRFSELLTLYQ